MSARVSVVILGEDKQHIAFVRRILKKMGWTKPPRVVPLSAGRGAGEHWVREQFPRELEELRRRHVAEALFVILDGDKDGPDRRKKMLEEQCRAVDIPFRSEKEPVAIFVPTWSMETWLAYLEGQAVDESVRTYRKLRRERDSRWHVKQMAEMCRHQSWREPIPPSLQDARVEYHRVRELIRE